MVKREVKIDWGGALLIAAAVSLLLIWVSFAGNKYDWLSWQTAAMVGGAVAARRCLPSAWRSKASEPIIPLWLFRNRTISLAVVASLVVGIGMFGASIFLSQYFQLGRGETPDDGRAHDPAVDPRLLVCLDDHGADHHPHRPVEDLPGRRRCPAHRRLRLMGTLQYDTPYWLLGDLHVLHRRGLGMTMQNLVLAVQNQVRLAASSARPARWSRSSARSAARSASRRWAPYSATGSADYIADGLAELGIHDSVGRRLHPPICAALPAPVRAVVRERVRPRRRRRVPVAAPSALIALIAVLFIKEVPLRRHNGDPLAAEVEQESTVAAGGGAAVVRTGIRD